MEVHGDDFKMADVKEDWKVLRCVEREETGEMSRRVPAGIDWRSLEICRNTLLVECRRRPIMFDVCGRGEDSHFVRTRGERVGTARYCTGRFTSKTASSSEAVSGKRFCI